MRKDLLKKIALAAIAAVALSAIATKTQAGEMVYYNGEWYPVVQSSPTPAPHSSSTYAQPTTSHQYAQPYRGREVSSHPENNARANMRMGAAQFARGWFGIPF